MSSYLAARAWAEGQLFLAFFGIMAITVFMYRWTKELHENGDFKNV